MTKTTLLKTPRQRAWEFIRSKSHDFTVAQIAELASMKIDATRDFFRSLKRAGFIEEAYRVTPMGKGCVLIHYRLINDVGQHAPSVRRDGKLLKPCAVNQSMWNTLRICGEVTPRMLAAQASTELRKVSEETANSYLQTLRKAGYVQLTSKCKPGRQAHYILLPARNTGPKAPKITRAQRVIDGNTGEVWQEMPELDDERREGTLLEPDHE